MMNRMVKTRLIIFGVMFTVMAAMALAQGVGQLERWLELDPAPKLGADLDGNGKDIATTGEIIAGNVTVYEPTQSETIATFTHSATDENDYTPLRIKSEVDGARYQPVLETPVALVISATKAGTTAKFRLLPDSDNIYLQNTAPGGDIYFTGSSAATLTGDMHFKGSGTANFYNQDITTTGTATAEHLGTTDDLTVDGQTANAIQSTTLAAAATTLAVTKNVVTLTGDAGTNTLATITGGLTGQTITILFVDANVTITDTDAHTADTVDLSAAFTSADDTVLVLFYDGTSWYEVSRSVN